MITATVVFLGGLALGTGAKAPAAHAIAPHDTEHSQVLVTFSPDGTFQVDVRGDPVWFLDRLDRLTGLPLSGALEGEARDRRLVELEEIFGHWVWIFFDGERLEVKPEYIPPAPLAPGEAENRNQPRRATMRLRGTVPEGATLFSFAYGLVLDDYPLVFEGRNGELVVQWVIADLESDRFKIEDVTPPSRWNVILTYLRLGFTHILPKGADHILFVIGIYLLSTRLRPIMAQVTTFTVAHTITLGLTIFGIISLRSSIVEPLIALSIAYVAVENLFTSELKPWRLALVFGFGLLHGMGFAGVLSELGLPRSERVTALLSFNLGVEGGQLAVIAMMFATVGWLRHKEWYRRRVVVPMSLVIAATGLYWTVTRIMGS